MNRLEEIRERLGNYKEEYLPYFESNGQMHEWHQMFEDNQYLLNEVERLKGALKEITEVTIANGEISAGDMFSIAVEALKEG